MEIKFWLNGKMIKDEIEPDILLLEYVRSKGCYSVKRGCETANCGLCTVWVENKPVLSCSTLAAQVNNKHVVTLEGVQERAIDFGTFLAKEGAEQCGYCSPGLRGFRQVQGPFRRRCAASPYYSKFNGVNRNPAVHAHGRAAGRQCDYRNGICPARNRQADLRCDFRERLYCGTVGSIPVCAAGAGGESADRHCVFLPGSPRGILMEGGERL